MRVAPGRPGTRRARASRGYRAARVFAAPGTRPAGRRSPHTVVAVAAHVAGQSAGRPGSTPGRAMVPAADGATAGRACGSRRAARAGTCRASPRCRRRCRRPVRCCRDGELGQVAGDELGHDVPAARGEAGADDGRAEAVVRGHGDEAGVRAGERHLVVPVVHGPPADREDDAAVGLRMPPLRIARSIGVRRWATSKAR